MLQCLDQDALHTTHVNQVHVQGSAAGGVEALGGVALPHAQELVALPDPGPRQGPVKESVGKFGHCGSLLRCAALDTLWSPQGVGGQFRRVVQGIGGSAPARLPGMHLDQTSLVVDTYQFGAQANLHQLPRRAQGRRHRVKSVLAGYVVVWMHLGRAPVSDLVGIAVPWGQDTAFLIQEDLQGLTPGGAVAPLWPPILLASVASLL